MALNCSSRPPLLAADDCAGMMLGCGCRSEEASPLSSCGVSSLWWDDLELELEELEELDESDPVDLLPTDPFGMNLETSFTAAIASCIEDLTVMSGTGHFGNDGDDDLFADLSYHYLNQAFMFAPEPCIGGYMGVFEGSVGFGGLSGGGGMDNFSRLPLAPAGSMEGPSSSCEAPLACCDTVDAAPVQEGNDAHEGLGFVLGYLDLREILSLEMVCKSLRSAVRSEPFLWKCIHIDSRLGKQIKDADLLRLTQKSPGSLQCLSIEGCTEISDRGLKAVLESNLQLTKLGIFGAYRMTYQGLIDNLRSFNMVADIGIKKLRLANRFTLSEAQYEELLPLLRIDNGQALHKQEPRIYNPDSFLPDPQGGFVPDGFMPDLHDEYCLDVEKCPLCPNYKLVFDCPSEECKISGSVTCRGCAVCIQRCIKCGKCINGVYHENFQLESVCPICQPPEDSSPEK